ncbi:MAG: sugar ABC transporter substrate-binding protein [Candidatus Symbiobacter sp.]|nr:sugar ABC transporter substrate-binding protein [Candidatus Symbiobacter sp.]
MNPNDPKLTPAPAHPTPPSRRQFLLRSGQLAALLALLPSRKLWAATKATITMIKGPHSPNEAKYEAAIIANFAKIAPDVTVNFTTYDWPNMNAQLAAGFASGSPADVLYLVDLVYPAYSQKNQLLNMAEMIAEPGWKAERANIEPFAWSLATSKNGVWGVPVLGAVYNIFINQDLLDKSGHGKTWNKSYASMMAAAKASTKGDVYGLSMRTKVGDFAFWDWFPYIHNAGGDILNADWSKNGLENSGAADAMQFLIDLHQAGVTPKVGSLDTQGQFDLFKAGKIAIYHGETPQINELLAKPPGFKWDVAMVPPGPKGQTVMGNFGILSIAAASPNKDAAWAFIKHWASAPEVGRFAREVSLQVVRRDIAKDLFKDNPAMNKIQRDFVPRVKGLQPHPQILKMLQSIWPVAENAYLGNLTGKEAIAQMAKIIDGLV